MLALLVGRLDVVNPGAVGVNEAPREGDVEFDRLDAVVVLVAGVVVEVEHRLQAREFVAERAEAGQDRIDVAEV